MRQIYFYKESYFRSKPLRSGETTKLAFQNRPEESSSYCVNISWKYKSDNLIPGLNAGLDVTNVYAEADNQPPCINSGTFDGPFDTADGLPYDQYRWVANTDYTCKLSTQAC